MPNTASDRKELNRDKKWHTGNNSFACAFFSCREDHRRGRAPRNMVQHLEYCRYARSFVFTDQAAETCCIPATGIAYFADLAAE